MESWFLKVGNPVNRVHRQPHPMTRPRDATDWYYGFIGRMAGSKEELKASRGRTKWPTVKTRCADETEPPSSCAEDEIVNGSALIVQSRDKKKRKASNKKNASDAHFQAFLDVNNIFGGDSPMIPTVYSAQQASHSMNPNRHVSQTARIQPRSPSSSSTTQDSVDHSEVLSGIICSSSPKTQPMVGRSDTFSDNSLSSSLKRQPSAEHSNVSSGLGSQEKADDLPFKPEAFLKFFEQKFNSLEAKLEKELKASASKQSEVMDGLRDEISEVKDALRAEISEVKDIFCKLPNEILVQNWVNNLL